MTKGECVEANYRNYYELCSCHVSVGRFGVDACPHQAWRFSEGTWRTVWRVSGCQEEMEDWCMHKYLWQSTTVFALTSNS